LKNLDYRKDTSKVHKFTSTLNGKCDINNRESLYSKNSTEYKDKEIAKTFTSFYTSADHILKYLKKQETHMKHTIKEKCRITNQENIFNTDFKPHELTQAIASLKTRKSPETDHIMTEFLNHLGPVAFDTLLKLCNQIWKTSIPAMWRKAIIISLLKAKKPASELSSYRPISLTSTLVKTMEKWSVRD
jgi:hypothetical protein